MRTSTTLGVSVAALTVFLSFAAGSVVGGDGGTSSSGPSGSTASGAAVTMTSATPCKGLDADQHCVDPTTSFNAGDTVFLGGVIAGRPTSGTVKAEFWHRDNKMAEASYDLAEVNGGVIASFGQDTYMGFRMAHEQPLPVGTGYRIDVFHDDARIGSWTYTINRPGTSTHGAAWRDGGTTRTMTDAGPSDPTSTFGPGDPVIVYGLADLGIASWVQVEFARDGQPMPSLTQYRTGEANVKNAGVIFTLEPADAQPGSWEVAVIGDGAELARYPFTVAASPG